MATRAEQQQQKKIELAELTKIAKAVLIDAFKDHEDGQPAGGTWGWNDVGQWAYIPSTRKQFVDASIVFRPSSSNFVRNHMDITYRYQHIDTNGNVINRVNQQAHWSTYNNGYGVEASIKMRHEVLVKKFLEKKNWNTRGLLSKEKVKLKLSHRPTEEQYAWAAEVIKNADINIDTGTHSVNLEYNVKIIERVVLAETNGVEEAKSNAIKFVANRSAGLHITGQLVEQLGTSRVVSTTFVEQSVYIGGSFGNETFDEAREIE